ncbi:DUF84 family protein [Caldalkalibacillus salinus]|uniref:DUF84 family protein n=1 Tax=Caldalkalibacillus salinus TaxID=2803787 RepID=UPI0019232BB6|nr:DUF84 family protein [Caldalkalibacillus salinus]
MHIYVGSLNPTKIKAVEMTIEQVQKTPGGLWSNSQEAWHIQGEDVSSDVSSQPMSDEETIEGAMNRCRHLRSMYAQGICIGLEGGVQDTSQGLFLCNWGAMLDEHDEWYLASGARVRLPDVVAEGIISGKELGEVIDLYAQKTEVRKNEGAIGILSHGSLDRSSMFAQVVGLLIGQKRHYAVSKM